MGEVPEDYTLSPDNEMAHVPGLISMMDPPREAIKGIVADAKGPESNCDDYRRQ